MQQAKEKARLEGGAIARATQAVKLTGQLKQLRKQRKEVQELDESGLFSVDKAAKAAVAALDFSERELANELRKLAGQEPLADEEEEEENDDD